MKPGDTEFGWFALLVLVLCCIGIQAQSISTGSFTQSSMLVPPDLMNRELTTLYNRQLKLTDYSGKITVINFFASWCVPCQMNLTDLIKIKQQYPGKGIEVIGVATHYIEPNIATVRKFGRLQQINFPVVWDDDGFGESLVKTVSGESSGTTVLGLTVLPQTFVIGKDGRILKHFEGFNPTITPLLLRETLDQVGKQEKRKS
jgi:thiol-disulfide isomerase/thioredoxin